MYYIWLELIEEKSKQFNFEMYMKIISRFENIEQLYNCSFNANLFKEKIYGLDIPNSVINSFLDNNIKDKTIEYLKMIYNFNGRIISYLDEEFCPKLYGISFCYIVKNNSKINLNNTNVYMLYEEYYSKYAKYLIGYFSKYLIQDNINVITDYIKEDIDTICIRYLENNLNDICEKDIVFISPNKEANILNNIVSIVVVIEARYEENTVSKIDNFVENGVEVLVVPSNIYRPNSYFSNYLIKEGATVILSKQDLKNVIKSNIC